MNLLWNDRERRGWKRRFSRLEVLKLHGVQAPSCRNLPSMSQIVMGVAAVTWVQVKSMSGYKIGRRRFLFERAGRQDSNIQC